MKLFNEKSESESESESKVHSVVWHDLRKNPNDLPNGDRIVLNQVGMAT